MPRSEKCPACGHTYEAKNQTETILELADGTHSAREIATLPEELCLLQKEKDNR